MSYVNITGKERSLDHSIVPVDSQSRTQESSTQMSLERTGSGTDHDEEAAGCKIKSK